ncbi:M20/M25/M40 family metallo-hydrolase [Candidatus Bathyarchaeota archaeon]|nr:M20/M25/M40 family metallo-hydrolase [Candidatus Bathyarchaeota archaeon]
MPSFFNVLDKIKGDEVAKLTLDLVKIHSETGKEQETQNFYMEYLKKAGLEVTLQPVDDIGRCNVIGKIPGTGKGRKLMLHSHLDTIDWSDCVQPYLNKEENRVYGRGSADMKGQCALQAVAAKAIANSGVKLKGDLYVIGSVGEETGTKRPDGTPWVIGAQATVEKKFPIVDAVVVLECHPPLGLALANKGSMGFEFTVFGADRILHESAVPFARNPTYWQAEVIEALMKLNRVLSKRKNRFVGPPYINVMSVSHPIFAKTIPMSIKIRGTRRVNFGETREGVLKEFGDLFGELCKRSLLKIEMNVTGEPVPWEISPDEPVVKSLQKAYKQVTKKTVLL